MKQKIFSLRPSLEESLSKLQALLDEGWIVKHANSEFVTTGSNNYVRGRIVYILEKQN